MIVCAGLGLVSVKVSTVVSPSRTDVVGGAIASVGAFAATSEATAAAPVPPSVEEMGQVEVVRVPSEATVTSTLKVQLPAAARVEPVQRDRSIAVARDASCRRTRR